MDDFIKKLIDNEENNIINSLAFMSYNPSIGRVLQENGVVLFGELVNKYIPHISGIQSKKDYDNWHYKFVSDFIENIRTNDSPPKMSIASYGQAQKAINVFMKVYIDWANKPEIEEASRLKKYLHVPLDKVLMKHIRSIYKSDKDFINNVWERMNKNYNYSLSKIDKDIYDSWQEFFIRKYSDRPIVFDNIWAENR